MKLEISLHAKDLKNVAGAFKGTSDPYAVITHIATTPGTIPKVLGKTEIVKNSLSPKWATVIEADYVLGEPMKIIVQVFDEVRKGNNKSMGSASFQIGEVLAARGCSKARKIKKDGGTIFCHVAKSQGSGELRLGLSATKLKNTEGFMRKSDPFYELSFRRDGAGNLTWDNIHRSETIKNNLSPKWEETTLSLSVLCQGDVEKPILITVYDHESDGDHVLMGQVETTVKELQDLEGSTLPLTKKGKTTGTLNVQKAEVTGVVGVAAMVEIDERMNAASISAPQVPGAFVPTTPVAPGTPFVSPTRPTFADYISGGCELNVCVAIDFTGSNGDPRKQGTLHYRSPYGELNDYEKAITSIVQILSTYDKDQMYPVLGFGAKYNGVVRHCFQCGPTAEVSGIQGILDAYRATFSSGLVMSKPTVITEVLQMSATKAAQMQQAAQSQGKQSYTILLILTDGSVSDPAATAEVLREASAAPISVVMVGIGNTDFSAMQFLDDSSSGDTDIAQFVPFNNVSRNSVELTSQTLREIPAQLVNYFQKNNIPPLAPIHCEEEEIVIEDEEEEEINLSMDFSGGMPRVAGGGSDFASGFSSY